MNKRQISANETKNRLITTAINLLKEHGFDAINVEDITKAAGVAKGTFYTHFKKKEDIALEISRTPFKELTDEMELRENKDIIENLTFYFKRFMELVYFLTQQKNKAAISVLHEPALAYKCNKILLLGRGWHYFGTPQDALKPKMLSRLYGISEKSPLFFL